MSQRLVITDVEAITPEGRHQGHVLVEDGTIVELMEASQSPPSDVVRLDGRGRLAIPGGVDGHCHVAQHTAGWDTKDTYASTSIAALWGGTTTILDFGIPRDVDERPLDAARRKLELSQEARCDVGLHSSFIRWDESSLEQFEQLWDLGLTSTKLYATNRGSTMADEDTILAVMHEMAERDGLVYLHAEHDAMVADCTARAAAAGAIDISTLPQTRPEIVEEASVAELLAMARYTGAASYFVHQSTPGAVALVRQAKEDGLRVYSETCPHYLAIDDSVYASGAAEEFACCPPMRSRETMLALAALAADGGIDTLASDHSCYDLTQKREHKHDTRLMPHGLPGVELRLPVAWTTLVHERGMSPEAFVQAFATGPAGINGLTGKGVIAAGADADIVLIDPDEVRDVRHAELHMGSDFSPFEGRTLRGWPSTVVSAGRIVLDQGYFIDPGPVGRFLARG